MATFNETAEVALPVAATGRIGGTCGKMLWKFQFNQSQCLDHYCKLSNVESMGLIMKAKFGESLRYKKDVEMVNEALFKVLCHNVVVLIGVVCELGMEKKFWEASVTNRVYGEGATEDDFNHWPWI